VIRAILSGDDEGFLARRGRRAPRAWGCRPSAGWRGIILSSPKLEELSDFAMALAERDAPLRRIDAQLFGPAPAPIARVRGRHRVRMLIKAAKGAPLQPALRAWTGQLKPPHDLRVAIDIDPQSFW
jgi:primosomal protein N' (replication factor Y) (superfamily II helicase)